MSCNNSNKVYYVVMRRKKAPGDYPQFSFRVSPDDKEELMDKANDLYQKFNSSLKDDQRVYKKNEILIAALKIGLKQIKKADIDDS